MFKSSTIKSINLVRLSPFLLALGMMSGITTSCSIGIANIVRDSTSGKKHESSPYIATYHKSDSTSNKPKIKFDPKQPFELISAKTGITTSSSAYPDTSMCKGWTIPKKAIPGIIKSCKIVTGEDIHHSFEVLPCIVSGLIIQNGHQFKYEINGGSWIRISSGDTTMLLANSAKENEKYFIIKEWDGKE